MTLVRRGEKGSPVSAAEYDAVVDQVENNQDAVKEIEARFIDAEVTLSFGDLAEATAYWTEQNNAGNTPSNDVLIFLEDLKEDYKWDSSVAAKAVETGRAFFEKAEVIEKENFGLVDSDEVAREFEKYGKKEISFSPNLLEDTTTTDGFFLNSSDEPTVFSGASYTDYIDVSGYESIWIKNAAGALSFGGSGYNANQTKISSISLILNDTGFQEINTSSFSFVRINIRNFNINNDFLLSNVVYQQKYELEYLKINKNQIKDISPRIFTEQGLTVEDVVLNNLLTDISATPGFYINSSNEVKPLSGASYTDYINVKNYDKIWFKNVGASYSAGGYGYGANQSPKRPISLTLNSTGFQEIDTSDFDFVRLNYRNFNINLDFLLSNEQYNAIGKKVIPELYFGKEEEKVYDFSITTRNTDTFIGGVNNFLDEILALNPLSKFFFITYHNKDGVLKDNSLINLIKTQEALAKYHSCGVSKIYEKLGWTNKSSNAVNTLTASVPDNVHPASDLENVKRIAGIITDDMQPIFKDWSGKMIRWIGHSIPNGLLGTGTDFENKYPLQVADILGASVVTSTANGAVMRVNKSDGAPLGTVRPSFTNGIQNYKDLVGTPDEPDLWVINLGYNDFIEDSTDFNIDFDFD